MSDTTDKREKTVLDQDTVIGDAMVRASQLFYEVANQIATCINENCQEAIDCEKLQQAALALAYMQGVDFGLAMDDKVMKWYLAEMEKSMATILASRRNAFQTQIYVPPSPSRVMDFDEFRVSGDTMFIHSLNTKPPKQSTIEQLKKEVMEDKNCKRMLQRIAEEGYDELFNIFTDLERPAPVQDVGPNPTAKDTPIAPAEQKAEDDSPSALNLRNLFRGGKIDKSQFVSGLATLVATGLITKSEFTRLKASC